MGLFEALVGIALVAGSVYYILVQLRLYVDDRIESEREETKEYLLLLKNYTDKKFESVNDRLIKIELRLDQNDKERVKNNREIIEVEKSVLQNFL